MAAARVLVVVAVLFAWGTTGAVRGDDWSAAVRSVRSADGAETAKPSTGAGGQGVERQFKGKLDPIGPFSLRDLDGRLWSERDFRGKVLIVLQWAAWCGPCVAEFPRVQGLYDSIRRDGSMAFISLDMDENPTTIGAFLRQFRKEYSFPVLFAGERFKIKALPCTWIVDREGYIREAFPGSGPGWAERVRSLAAAVEKLPSVSSLPSAVREAQRAQNERDAANSR